MFNYITLIATILYTHIHINFTKDCILYCSYTFFNRLISRSSISFLVFRDQERE